MKLLIIFSFLVIFTEILPSYGQKEFPLKPLLNYSNGFTNSSNDLLEIGISIDIDTTNFSHLKLGVRVPQNEDDENSAKIDKTTDNYNFFLGGEFILKNIAISNKNKTVFWGVEPIIEFGSKEFKYHPDSTKNNSEEIWKNNLAVELNSRYFISARGEGAWQWGIFGRFRYSNSNKASDAIGVLNSNSTIVNDLVVLAPSSKKILTPAFGLNVYPGTDFQFSFAPIFYYYWLDEDENKDFERQRFRSEQWLYFYPLSEDNHGLRIGFGAFQDHYTEGKQDDENTLGLLVNVKMDTNILKFIF